MCSLGFEHRRLSEILSTLPFHSHSLLLSIGILPMISRIITSSPSFILLFTSAPPSSPALYSPSPLTPLPLLLSLFSSTSLSLYLYPRPFYLYPSTPRTLTFLHSSPRRFTSYPLTLFPSTSLPFCPTSSSSLPLSLFPLPVQSYNPK